MTSATDQSLSPVEVAWINRQTAENPPITMVALVCEEPLDPSSVKARIEDRLLAERRLRQRIGHSHLPLARPRWQEHPEFQLADHFLRVDLRDHPADTALVELADRLATQPLDESLPLWQLHLVELPGGSSAAVLRLHAAVADSRAAAALALRLTDAESAVPSTAIGLEHRVERQSLRERGARTAAATHMLCRLITSRADRDNPLRRPPTGSRSLRWSTPVDLASLSSPASPVTEHLLAAVAGSLRRAIQQQDLPAEDVEVRAVVSVDLRQAADPGVGTLSALAMLRLPISIPSQAMRVEALSGEIDRLARTPEAFALLGCESERTLSMSEIEEHSLRLLSQKATLGLAILDGPAQRQLLCGKPISELLWWPAPSGELALGISVIGYAGAVRFAISCDMGLAVDAATLAADMATAAMDH